jgi:hypothetical protein
MLFCHICNVEIFNKGNFSIKRENSICIFCINRNETNFDSSPSTTVTILKKRSGDQVSEYLCKTIKNEHINGQLKLSLDGKKTLNLNRIIKE